MRMPKLQAWHLSGCGQKRREPSEKWLSLWSQGAGTQGKAIEQHNEENLGAECALGWSLHWGWVVRQLVWGGWASFVCAWGHLGHSWPKATGWPLRLWADSTWHSLSQPSLGSEQVWRRIPELLDISEDSQRRAKLVLPEAGWGRAKWPWKLRVWAKLLSNYIALQTRQNCVSWKACMQSQGKSSEGRPGGNWSKESCYRVHCHPGRKSREEAGEAVCHSAECYTHAVKNRTHLNGVGDSERKCVISLRISHHSLWNLI